MEKNYCDYLKKLTKDELFYLGNEILNIISENVFNFNSKEEMSDIKILIKNIDNLIKNEKRTEYISNISEDTIESLTYEELKCFINTVNFFRKKSGGVKFKTESFAGYLYKIIREKIVLYNVVPLSEMTMEQYDILLKNVSGNTLGHYAIDCGVEEEELNSEVMYKKYHRK